jgi:phosphoserine phosphatase
VDQQMAATMQVGAAFAAGGLPICVDMDGTLLRVDMLHEATLAAACDGPAARLRLLSALRRGKATLKLAAAEAWSFDPATLPYSRAVLDYLAEQRAAGRRIVLRTAAHRRIAERVAAHLDLSDAVIATEGGKNLRGARKAAALEARFGRGGFIYLGNDATDLPVWERAGGVVVVNAPATVLRRARAQGPVVVLEDRAARMLAACTPPNITPPPPPPPAPLPAPG